MAERLKSKQNGGGLYLKKGNHNRHGSADEYSPPGNAIIASTNDSRVEDMLPNVNSNNVTIGSVGGGSVQHRQNTKSV